jgi:hypothetical protein
MHRGRAAHSGSGFDRRGLEQLGHGGQATLVLAGDDPVGLRGLPDGALRDGQAGDGHFDFVAPLGGFERCPGTRRFSHCVGGGRSRLRRPPLDPLAGSAEEGPARHDADRPRGFAPEERTGIVPVPASEGVDARKQQCARPLHVRLRGQTARLRGLDVGTGKHFTFPGEGSHPVHVRK